MNASKQNPILLGVKKEPLNILELESEMSESVTLVNENLMELDAETNIHEIKEYRPRINISNNKSNMNSFETLKITKMKRKRGRKHLNDRIAIRESAPQRCFSTRWLTKPELKDWVTPVPGKPSYVSCKWCKVLLRAHLHDLKKHGGSKKHRKHSVIHSNISSPREENDYLDTYLNNISTSTTEQKLHEKSVENGAESQNVGDADAERLTPMHIGFIGCGNMAQALISGFISNGLIEPSNLLVSAPSNKNLVKLKPLGIKTTHDNKRVVEESHMVYLAVKPHIIPEVLANLEPIESGHNPLFVSMATGLSIARLEAMLNHVVTVPQVIRIMPNTPCMVLQGCCVYSLGSNVHASEGKAIKCLLESVGLCEEVPENMIDGVCGLAGSGPAYIYAVIEAMADGGVKMGLPRNLALALAAQTVKGAATMVLETGKHPGQLKDEVCSPGGTTITAMHVLEKNGIRNAFISAVEAAANRSKELG